MGDGQQHGTRAPHPTRDDERPAWSLGWFAERCESLARWADGAHERERARATERANPPDVVDATWQLYAAAMRDAARCARDWQDIVDASTLPGLAAETARSQLAEMMRQRWTEARAAGRPAHASWWAYFEAWEWSK